MLDDRPFRLRDRGIDGQRPRAYKSRQWAVPFRGVRMPVALVADLDARIRAAGVLIPADFAVGGWAAAALHGDRWSTGVDAAGRPVPILVFGPRPQGIRSREGLKPRRARLDAGDVVDVGGLAVTSPVRTAFDLARLGRRLDVSVPSVDAML